MIRFNPLNPRTVRHWVRGFNGLKRIIADQLHSYEIASHIQQVSGDLLKVEEGSLYLALLSHGDARLDRS